MLSTTTGGTPQPTYKRSYKLLCGAGLCAMAINAFAAGAAGADQSDRHDAKTATPIKHVIVLIGEKSQFR